METQPKSVDSPPSPVYSLRAARVMLLIALVVAFVFTAQYQGAFALAALVAALSMPLHNRLKNYRRTTRWATPITIVTVVLLVLGPILLMLALSFNDILQISGRAQTAGIVSEETLQKASDSISSSLSNIPGVVLPSGAIAGSVADIAKQVVPAVVTFIVQASGNIFAFFINTLIFFMTYALLLSRNKQVMRVLRHMSPFSNEVDDEYLRGVRSMAVAMVKGTAVIALVVGAIATASLWIIGFPYLPFWFVLFTLLSFIPLGAGIVYIPIGIILLLTGNTWQGVLVLLVQLIIINNVDNVLRPRLAPKEANLPAVLLLVGAFAGVHFFGTLGVVYGPIIMILLYTTVSLYDRYRVKGIPVK